MKTENRINNEILQKEIWICERCQKKAFEVRTCDKCGAEVCEDCLVVYDQFNQVDYDCCKDCYKR